MSNLLGNSSRLSRLLFVFTTIGDLFFKTVNLASVIKRYVYNSEQPEETTSEDDIAIFTAESQSIRYLHSDLLIPERDRFREFHDYTLLCGQPMATVLLSSKENCKNCHKNLSLDPKPHPVVVYSLHRGTYLGCRLSKLCRKCKLHQHYGFCTQDGKKTYDEDVLSNDFILSSEDTAFDAKLLEECSNLLVIGAVPFSTYASSYNRRFCYSKNDKDEVQNPKVKRMKRYVT